VPTSDWILNLQILTSGGYRYAPEPSHHSIRWNVPLVGDGFQRPLVPRSRFQPHLKCSVGQQAPCRGRTEYVPRTEAA